MKFFIFIFFFIPSLALAQDLPSKLKEFDAKIYSLKLLGVRDLSVDIVDSDLTNFLNSQKTFGKIDELIFRVFWTQSPDRLKIQIIGLPDGFKQIKEDLKKRLRPLLDHLIPLPLSQRFAGYKFSQGPTERIIKANDTSGVAIYPTLNLSFDELGRLSEVMGEKPFGEMKINYQYVNKEKFGAYFFPSLETTVIKENGQRRTTEKEIEYKKHKGIIVIDSLKVRTNLNSSDSENKNFSSSSQSVIFKNYRINESQAQKYFLGN